MAACMKFTSLLSKIRFLCNVQMRYGSGLYSPAMLGVSRFQKRRLEVKDSIGNYKDKFLSRMKEELIKKDQKIYTCDLITMIELAETQEQIDLTVELVYRYEELMKNNPFENYYAFGPMLLRLYYINNMVDEAWSLFLAKIEIKLKVTEEAYESMFHHECLGYRQTGRGDTELTPTVRPWFRKVICFQIMMDMLYQDERYEDVIMLYTLAQEYLLDNSQNIITSVFAALYQQNTEESLNHLMYIMNDLFLKKMLISSRTITFALMLALNQKKPDIAIEIYHSPACQRTIKSNKRTINFKILSFVQLGRLEDAVRILEDMAKDHYLEGILMLFSETINEVEAAILKTDNLDSKHNFRLLKRALYRGGLVCPQTFQQYVTSPITSNRLRTSFKDSSYSGFDEIKRDRLDDRMEL